MILIYQGKSAQVRFNDTDSEKSVSFFFVGTRSRFKLGNKFMTRCGDVFTIKKGFFDDSKGYDMHIKNTFFGGNK
jgi:hypothetical protein